jgi:hypothetical protein
MRFSARYLFDSATPAQTKVFEDNIQTAQQVSELD